VISREGHGRRRSLRLLRCLLMALHKVAKSQLKTKLRFGRFYD
jgi:hypothetical protein